MPQAKMMLTYARCPRCKHIFIPRVPKPQRCAKCGARFDYGDSMDVIDLG